MGMKLSILRSRNAKSLRKLRRSRLKKKDISIEKNDESDTKSGESSGFSRIFTNESSIDETKSEEQTIPEENVIEVSKEEVTMKDASDIIKEEKGDEENESKHLEDTSVGTSLFGTCTEETEKKLDLTAAAYGDDEEVKDVEILLNQKSAPLLEHQIVQEETTLKMTTGDAIFADLPPMPNLNSTGASIFGVSEEAALDSTGATLFGVHAPREARPELGAMTGWDDAFDQKFNLADVGNVAKPGDPFDPFITSEGAVPSNDPFGVGEVTVNKVEGFGYDDGFSKAKSITAVKNTEENPFLETLEPPEDEPLFDDDTSQPLEPFPRLDYSADGWEMFLRHPPKKKTHIPKILEEIKDSKDPFQELPLQSAYSVSDISHQKEPEFDLEFASDMKKLGVPLEHAPQISELLKLGSYSFEDLKQFTVSIEEKLFGMDIHRDRSLTYKTEEVQLTAVDELYVEQDKNWKILKQLARVNDMERMGLEVVGRHDILPVPTEQWIRYEDIEFHSVIDKKAFESEDHIIKFQPPDACYLELMRFRVRPPRSRELPLLARCNFEITGNNVIIKADMLIPYHHTKAWGQVPCDDVSMRIPPARVLDISISN
ncbi:STON1_2 [Lepeophtheirus salmonis]|uniref:STON1_2 n=1 Tax=Lepeophtheirus salmonis TaxID=72036 RepID=A0A7R8CZL7_LEPSM|nr:STON1_2 [Lepeophtheirus salmonis]CAF2935520.1 STON1_2 [Lepeophtheirus salmonis]